MRASRKAEIQTLSNYKETLVQRKNRILEEHKNSDGNREETRKRVEEAERKLAQKEAESGELARSFSEMDSRLADLRNQVNTLASRAEDLTVSIWQEHFPPRTPSKRWKTIIRVTTMV